MTDEASLLFGPGVFGEIHRPSGSNLPGWVICNPFGKERTNSNRLGFKWAQCLAAAGHWVLRFDYRGTGDSAGSFEDFTVHDYVEDLRCAKSELERLSGLPCRGFVGLRLGASVAAICAASNSGDLDLVLWEPVIDGTKYRNSLLRMALANIMVNAAGRGSSRSDLRNQLNSGESVAVDGFALKREMYESLADVDLISLGRPTNGRILMVQINTRRSQTIQPSFAELSSVYSSSGETRLVAVHEPPVWMRTRWYRWQLGDLFDTTLGWMSEHKPSFSEVHSEVPVVSGKLHNADSTERPIRFEVEGQIVKGILHQPLETREDLPNVVLLAAGEACRTAFFYRKLAIEIASRGWNVLRFDPRGIGDSQGDLDCTLLTEVFYRVESGALVADTVAAMEYMGRECGVRDTVLIGLCGGAITSILTAQADKHVVGIAPLELPMRLTPRAEPNQQITMARQIPWDESLSRHRGAFFLLKALRLYQLLKSVRRRVGVSLGSAAFWRPGNIPGEKGWYRERIGDDASCAVLVALEKTLDRGIPVFCVFADSEQPGLFEQVLPGLLTSRADKGRLLRYRVVQGADHNFTMPGFSEELSADLIDWLDDPGLRVH